MATARRRRGRAPLDLRPLTGAGGPRIWWTEWGVTPTHFAPVNDAVFGAPFVLRGVKAALGSADALAYWVVSDHFEELGWPPTLFHGGFGLLTVGNLRKPRYWAFELLGRLGPERLAVTVAGDGAGGLVDALAAGRPDGSIAVLVWNGTLDQSKVEGDRLLDREVTVRVEGLAADRYRQALHRIDADRLEPAEPAHDLPVSAGVLELSLAVPMPGVALLELAPAR